MAFTKQKADGRITSTLVVAILLAVAAGLYLQIILIDRPTTTDGEQSLPRASIQVLEGREDRSAAPESTPLPSDQMDLILRVFAPENASD